MCRKAVKRANFGKHFSRLFAPKSQLFQVCAQKVMSCFFCTGEDSLVDDNRRLEVKSLKKDIDELIYEWVDVNEDDDDDSGEEDSTDTVDEDYCKALRLAVRRYDLMEKLGFKAISLLDGLSTCVEIARDAQDFNAVKQYAKKGREKAAMLYGHGSQEVMEWESILISCEN